MMAFFCLSISLLALILPLSQLSKFLHTKEFCFALAKPWQKIILDGYIMYICIYIYMYTYVCIYIHIMFVDLSKYLYLCMYACTYVNLRNVEKFFYAYNLFEIKVSRIVLRQ